MQDARYSHTQVAYWMVVTMAGIAAVIAVRAGSAALFGLMCVVTGAAMTLFGSLTTSVGDDAVLVRFGPIPLIRKRIQLTRIVAARAVRNSPVYGWGMRYIPHGRLWNVWGLDAVELQLDNGSRFRIGTDEPAALLEALRASGVRTAPGPAEPDRTAASGV